ncbi:unnamed protein product, partial [marine sediment metagenome]
DALLLMTDASLNQFKYDKAVELLKLLEGVYNKLPKERSKEYFFKEAYLNLLKGRSILIFDPDRAFEHFKQSLSLWGKINSKIEEAITLSLIGSYFDLKGKFNQAIKYLKQSLAIAKGINHNRGIANVLGSLGVSHWSKGELDLSLLYYKQSLKLYEEIGNKQHVAVILNNIGLHYSE